MRTGAGSGAIARFRAGESGLAPDFEHWWDAVSGLTMPIMLVRALAWSVVGDDDVAELLRRQPTAQVVGVEGAGHSIQGDRPRELAAILSMISSSPRRVRSGAYELRGEGSNLQHPAPKADVLPIELPRTAAGPPLRGPVRG